MGSDVRIYRKDRLDTMAKNAVFSKLMGGDMVTLVITGSGITKIESEGSEQKVT